jgi:hypothetical protein
MLLLNGVNIHNTLSLYLTFLTSVTYFSIFIHHLTEMMTTREIKNMSLNSERNYFNNCHGNAASQGEIQIATRYKITPSDTLDSFTHSNVNSLFKINSHIVSAHFYL